MGQRLNIEITDGTHTLASCLYRYSATTYEAIRLTTEIIESYTKWFRRSGIDIYIVLRVLEHTGAGVCGAERQRIRSDENHDLAVAEFMPARGLSDGLMFLTKEGISEARRWEDARVTIDIKGQAVCFGVFYYTLAEEYFADEGMFREVEELPFMDADGNIFNQIHFDNFAALKTLVDNAQNGVRLRNGDVIEWIF